MFFLAIIGTEPVKFSTCWLVHSLLILFLMRESILAQTPTVLGEARLIAWTSRRFSSKVG